MSIADRLGPTLRQEGNSVERDELFSLIVDKLLHGCYPDTCSNEKKEFISYITGLFSQILKNAELSAEDQEKLENLYYLVRDSDEAPKSYTDLTRKRREACLVHLFFPALVQACGLQYREGTAGLYFYGKQQFLGDPYQNVLLDKHYLQALSHERVQKTWLSRIFWDALEDELRNSSIKGVEVDNAAPVHANQLRKIFLIDQIPYSPIVLAETVDIDGEKYPLACLLSNLATLQNCQMVERVQTIIKENIPDTEIRKLVLKKCSLSYREYVNHIKGSIGCKLNLPRLRAVCGEMSKALFALGYTTPENRQYGYINPDLLMADLLGHWVNPSEPPKIQYCSPYQDEEHWHISVTDACITLKTTTPKAASRKFVGLIESCAETHYYIDLDVDHTVLPQDVREELQKHPHVRVMRSNKVDPFLSALTQLERLTITGTVKSLDDLQLVTSLKELTMDQLNSPKKKTGTLNFPQSVTCLRIEKIVGIGKSLPAVVSCAFPPLLTELSLEIEQPIDFSTLPSTIKIMSLRGSRQSIAPIKDQLPRFVALTHLALYILERNNQYIAREALGVSDHVQSDQLEELWLSGTVSLSDIGSQSLKSVKKFTFVPYNPDEYKLESWLLLLKQFPSLQNFQIAGPHVKDTTLLSTPRIAFNACNTILPSLAKKAQEQNLSCTINSETLQFVIENP